MHLNMEEEDHAIDLPYLKLPLDCAMKGKSLKRIQIFQESD